MDALVAAAARRAGPRMGEVAARSNARMMCLARGAAEEMAATAGVRGVRGGVLWDLRVVGRKGSSTMS